MIEYTKISNNFFDAVLKLKCPAKHKELLFTLYRLVNDDDTSSRAVSVNSIAKFLGQDKSNVAKRLKDLIKCNVIKETCPPGYTSGRVMVVNLNYSEWIPLKRIKYPLPIIDHEFVAQYGKPYPVYQNYQKSLESTTVPDSTTPPVTHKKLKRANSLK